MSASMIPNKEAWVIAADEAMARLALDPTMYPRVVAHEFMHSRQAWIEQQSALGADKNASALLWDANNMKLLSDEVREVVVSYCQSAVDAGFALLS